MLRHLTEANREPIAANGGIEAVACAMANHTDHRGVQASGVIFIHNMVYYPVCIAVANQAGVVPLLQHAAAMGIEHAANQLQRMGV